MPQARRSNGQFRRPHSLYSGVTGNGNGHHLDLIAINMLRKQMVANASTLRSTLTSRAITDPRRSINDEAGYPETTELDALKYREMYDRNPVAKRVVHALPEETWRAQPQAFEDEDSETVTEFEQAWDDLGRSLSDEEEETWYQDEEGNPIWEYLLRADVLSGIGNYGVLLLGFDDSENLQEPVKKGNRKLLYVKPIDESLINVVQWVNDVKDRRHGKPERYAITFADPSLGSISGLGLDLATRYVHWSRVIHIADNITSSDVLGVPRMQPVYDRLYDIAKVLAGDGEAYWRNVVMKIFLETHPQLGGEVHFDSSALKDELENLMNGLQQWAGLSGMHANTIAPVVVDPTPHWEVQIDAICVNLSIPKRIFVGSERGELASSQDARAWNDRLRARQRNYVTPRIIVPFINRLIRVGVLPKPKGYSIHWPDPEALSPQEKADVAVKRVQAMVTYVEGGADSLMAPQDLLTRELDYTEEEAQAILENALKHVDDTGPLNPEKAGEAQESQAQPQIDPETGLPMPVDPNAPAGTVPGAQLVDATGLPVKPGESQAEITPDTTAQDQQASELLGRVGGITGMMDLFTQRKDGIISDETLEELLILFYRLSREDAKRFVATLPSEEEQQARALEELEASRPPVPPGGKGAPGAPPFGKKPVGSPKKEGDPASRPFDDTQNAFCPTGKGGGVDPTCSSGGGAKHDVKLPSNPKKLKIDKAGEALDQMGYKLHFDQAKFDLKTKTQTYGITKPDGSHSTMTAKEISDIVYAGKK